MAALPERIRITRVHVAEARVQRMGPTPGALIRMVYMDEDGVSYGETRMDIVTEEAKVLFDQFCAQVEQDFVDRVMTPDRRDSPEEPPEDEEGSSAYGPEEDDLDLSFR